MHRTTVLSLSLLLGAAACISGDPKVVAACKNFSKRMSPDGSAPRDLTESCIADTEKVRPQLSPEEFDKRLQCWTDAESQRAILDCVPNADEEPPAPNN